MMFNKTNLDIFLLSDWGELSIFLFHLEHTSVFMVVIVQGKGEIVQFIALAKLPQLKPNSAF
jgi:hypothetical protein